MIAIKQHSMRRHAAAHVRYGQPLAYALDLHDTSPHDADYLRLLGEVTVLRQKKARIGMAIILGEIDKTVCSEIQRTLGKLADYVSYASCGPLVVVAFQRSLFEQLKPMWQDLLVGAPAICAGVAFPSEETNTHDLVLAARLALRRAIAMHCDLVAFDEQESAAEVASHRLACELKRDLDKDGMGLGAPAAGDTCSALLRRPAVQPRLAASVLSPQ